MVVLGKHLISGALLLTLFMWHLGLVGEETGGQRQVLLTHLASPSLPSPGQEEHQGQQQQDTPGHVWPGTPGTQELVSQGQVWPGTPGTQELLSQGQVWPATPGTQELLSQGQVWPGTQEKKFQETIFVPFHNVWELNKLELDGHENIITRTTEYSGLTTLEASPEVVTTRQVILENLFHKVNNIQNSPTRQVSSPSTLSAAPILSAEKFNVPSNTVDSHHRQRRQVGRSSANIKAIPEKNLLTLCDHPPYKFSPTFHGCSDDVLRGEHKTMVTSTFLDTTQQCHFVYYLIYNKFIEYYELGHYEVFVDKTFISICLPLHQKFNDCHEYEFLFICRDARIIFINPHTCPLPDDLDPIKFATLVLRNFYNGYTDCLEKICNGTYFVIERKMNRIRFQIQNLHRYGEGGRCMQTWNPLKNFINNETLYITTNTHWSSCYPLYTISWAGEPDKHGLHGGWSYLPRSCLAGEVLLVVMVTCVAVSGVVGNLVVVAVMVGGGHRGEASSLLRTNLAVADLLTALFVVLPSVYYHLLPFLTPPDYKLLSEDTVETGFLVGDYEILTQGFPLLQALFFSVFSIVNFLTIFILSVERFILTSNALKYGEYISVPIIKGLIFLIWIVAILDSMFLCYDNKINMFSAGWSTFHKLPIGVAFLRKGISLTIINGGQILLFSVVCLSTITYSVLAIISFLREEARVQAEFRELGIRVSGFREKETRHILTTQLLITLFFLLSVLPFSIGIAKTFFESTYRQTERYLSAWFFVASISWNPWIYNMRSRQFRQDVASTMKAVTARLNACLRCVCISRPPDILSSDCTVR
ncbi:uncharacterized protein LOC121868857 [Homarus americanus]|uniref:uncharacterized protein LOC121868857 n=1 Tax=Homarus americanus TaxID=6706 RepID=UPI001C4784EF|nr:uncharacterized protein LOC121868857 [Homarus americanus]